MIVKNRQAFDYESTARGVGIAGSIATSGIATGLIIPVLSKIGGVNITNMFTNISVIMYSLMTYYFTNVNSISPSVVMAGIPMPSVSEISHAMSDRILKYRATGGIFLAHQEGGEQTLRIQGKSFGPSRYMFLTMLDFLFLWGSAKVVDMFTTYTEIISPFPQPLGLPVTPQVDPWIQINEPLINEGKEESHLTFPVITKTKIYTNMYIETYDFTESVENGMNCLTYTIFLRKYTPHFPYKYRRGESPKGEVLWYYASNNNDEAISTLRQVDLMMEVGFSTSMVMYRFFQHLAGNSPETNIVYLTGININQQNLGEDKTSANLSKKYPDLDYDLNTLNLTQKEELMQVG